MSRKRPLSLYVFENYGFNKHIPGAKCNPTLISPKNEFGRMWLCGHMRNTFVGYDTLKAAELEAIAFAKERIRYHRELIEAIKKRRFKVR